ncbi:putative PurR-regulated permease PerM [Oceanisphaera litoralis]|uniref:AI-2E family transporter n=1 Tax=Oceanisphaera litoralis TaxID=225144 RepID=UPI00195C1BB7|nr:AI-2E family transporter [Oceanisphaera litoralis]MBM7455857.1 putative PurR-regulated permease PerM [Oceanisphaera litoralis]
MTDPDNALFGSKKASDDQKPLIDALNVRSVSLIILASVATVYFIDWAQAVLLPLMVAVFISYALDPLLSPFDRLKVPRPLSAAVVIFVLLAVMVSASIPLQREAVTMLDKVPVAINKFKRSAATTPPKEAGIIEKAQAAAKEIEDSTSDKKKARTPGVTSVRIVEKPFDVQEYLLGGASAALVMVSQSFSALLLVYFMLAVGKLYRRKVIRISGPSFERMRKAAHIMDDFHHQVRRFLFVMLLSAVFVGAFTWLAFWILDVEQAGLWGVLAGVASAIPYLGPLLVLLGTGMAAFLQFGTLDMAFIVAGASLVVTSIQGYLLTPWLTSHLSSLNPVAIFVGLSFWGWIWGPVGLIIATPMMMVIKSLCDHVTNLRPMGELLGK